MLANLIRGAAMGAAVGVAVGAAGHIMNQKGQASQDLGIVAPHVAQHAPLREIILRFKPIAAQTQEGQSLYVHMVRSCEAFMSLRDAKGAGQIKANRACFGAVAAAKQLTKQILRTNDLNAAPLNDDAEALESVLNNMLHNIMLEG